MNSTTTFWIVAAVFVAIALAFLLPPLLRNRQLAVKAGRRSINIAVYRDQMKEMAVDHRNGLLTDEQFAHAKLELEARLAQDAIDSVDEAPPVRRGGNVLGITLAVLVPLAAFGLYYKLGNQAALTATAPTAMAGAQGSHDIMTMIRQVEEKAQAEPDNVEAWTMLAKSYTVVDRWPEAQQAYEKAYALNPASAAIMTGYAEALAINSGRVLAGRPMELVLKALEIDPEDSKGLELAGISNFQDKNYAKATFYFKRLLAQLPPDTAYAQDIAKAMAEAQRMSEGGQGGLDNLSAPAQAAAKPAGPVAGARIHGKVDIAPALKARINPQDTVFLFARPSGGGAPIAAIRATAGNFPLEFELTDAMAMSPDNRLSNFKEVTLTARVAKSGEVKGAPGDLEGSLSNVKVGAGNISLVIDKVRN